MITKENIKLVEVVMFKDKNRQGDLTIADIDIQHKYRKAVEFNGKLIDIETSTELLPSPSVRSKKAKLFKYYYKDINDLLYVTNEDYRDGLIAFNNYLDSLIPDKQEGKILEFKRC